MYHQIQKMHRDGWKISRIASFLVLNRRTVSKYLALTEKEFLDYQSTLHTRISELDPYEGFVKIKLERYPETSAAQMQDWLKEHYTHFPDVSSKTVYNFVMRVRQEHNIPKIRPTRDFCIVEELPFAKQAQVDFGEYNMRDGKGKRIKVHFFTMVLSRSRYKFVLFSLTPFTASLAIYAHMKAFEYFGGIPKVIVYDQDKVFLVNENLGDLILTQEFKAFCDAMPFEVHFCRKSDPQSKGKVENVIKYVKQNFLYNRPFVDITILNREVIDWLFRTANGMPHAVTKQKPSVLWEQEQPHLLKIPPYTFNQPKPVCPVRQDNSLYYGSNLYSLPEGTYQGRGTEVIVQEENGRLIIKDALDNIICTHEVCPGQGRTICNTDHRRDKSKKLDNLLLDTAMTFPQYDKALGYLEKVRKAKSRYARDQILHIKKCVANADPDSILKTLLYCIDNGIYSATDFKSVLDKHLQQRKQTGKPITVEKQVRLSINKKITEVIPDTSNILDYERIMKN